MSSVLEEVRRRLEETRTRVRSQIANIRARLGLPAEGILGGTILSGRGVLSSGGGSPALPIVEETRRRVQTVMSNIRSRVQEIRSRVLAGKGPLGLLGGESKATTTTTEIVKKEPEKLPRKPAKVGIHY